MLLFTRIPVKFNYITLNVWLVTIVLYIHIHKTTGSKWPHSHTKIRHYISTNLFCLVQLRT